MALLVFLLIVVPGVALGLFYANRLVQHLRNQPATKAQPRLNQPRRPKRV